MKRIIAFLIALGFGGWAQAGLISYNGYTLDTDTNIVTGGGLEWLQWTQTEGLSYNDVTDSGSSLYQDGWRVASQSHMAGLFNDWGFGAGAWDSDENTQQVAILPTGDPAASTLAQDFITVFGLTHQSVIGDFESRLWSRAIFGNDSDGDGSVNLAEVIQPTTNYDGLAMMNRDFLASSQSLRFTGGVALVRSAQTVAVPEPSTLALLGLGLIGLSLRRRSQS